MGDDRGRDEGESEEESWPTGAEMVQALDKDQDAWVAVAVAVMMALRGRCESRRW